MNCKPGDLAIVIGDDDDQNVGRIVRVVGPAKWVDGSAWWCSVEGAPLLVRQYDDYERTYLANNADIYDDRLRPITGLPLDEETPVEHEVTA